MAHNMIHVDTILVHQPAHQFNRAVYRLLRDGVLTTYNVTAHLHPQAVAVHTDVMQRVMRAFQRTAAVPRTVRIADALHNTVLVHKIVRRRLYAVIMEILCIIHCSVTVVRRVMHHNVFNAVSASA